MKLFLILLLANLAASFLQGFLGAAWKSATPGVFPRLKWEDSKLMWRTSLSPNDNGASYKQLLNLQTPARRRELRQQHAEWVARMDRDYGMDFSHTL